MIDDLFNVEEVLTKEDTLFIIVKDEVNETLLNTLKHIWETDKIFIIIQPLKRLQFNILEHVLVPLSPFCLAAGAPLPFGSDAIHTAPPFAAGVETIYTCSIVPCVVAPVTGSHVAEHFELGAFCHSPLHAV
jgi:hypothetical protein